MCSTNVAFNMKTGECLNFFLEFLRLKHFWSLFSQLFSLIFLRSGGTKAWLMRKLHTRHVYHAIGSPLLMCKTD